MHEAGKNWAKRISKLEEGRKSRRKGAAVSEEEVNTYLMEFVESIPDSPDFVEDAGPIKLSLDSLKMRLFNFLPAGWIFDHLTKEFLKAICFYFTSDDRFFQSPLLLDGKNSFDKGLMIVGMPGIGKSASLFAMSKALTDSVDQFRFLEVADIIRNWNSEETDLTRRVYKPGSNQEIMNHVLIDDIGRDVDEKMYQYSFNPITVLINQRSKLSKHGVKTHIISNYLPRDLPYSPQIRDRVSGLCNIIGFTKKNSER